MQNFHFQDFIPQSNYFIVFVNDDFGPGTTGWGLFTFDNIQDAINNVFTNGYIYIYPGTYTKFSVDKRCKIIGIDRDNVTIDGEGNSYAVEIDASNVGIAYCNVTNASVFSISITDGSHNNIVRNCYIDGDVVVRSNNNEFFYNEGISNIISFTNENTSGNYIHNNSAFYDIWFYYGAHHNRIEHNSKAYHSGDYELTIRLVPVGGTDSYTFNDIKYNDCSDISIEQGIDTPLCKYNNIIGNDIGPPEGDSGIQLIGCSNNNIMYNTIHNSTEGLYLNTNSDNNIIYGNVFRNCNKGISIQSS